MEWGVPKNLIWLWVLPFVWGVFYLATFRKVAKMKKLGDIELVRRLVEHFDSRKRWMKRCLLFGALFLMIVALAQPHFKTKEIEVERKGVDVVIALDVSKSMLAKDIAPTRLDKAKLELTTLIDRLKQDRIGIVAFAGEAFIQCPLTLDKSAVKLFLLSASPNSIPLPGTAIGSAIRVATQAFSDKDKEYKALILLTDGEDHGSDPLGAAKKARDQGIRIFSIGIGTPDGSTIPGETSREGFKKDRQGRVVLSKLGENLLKQIAKETDGAYYRSTRGELEVESIVRQIRSMTQKSIRKEKTIEYEESFQYFLAVALLILFMEMALSERKRSPVLPKGKIAAGFLLIFFLPFLMGFKFYSAVKNEEGNKLYKKGQVGKAKNAYASALKSEPKVPEIAFNLGNAYYREGAFDQSLDTYKQAAQNEESASLQSKAFYNLGNTLFRKNELEKAKEFYKQALRLNPKDEDAKYNLELLNQKQNQEENKKDQQKQQDQKKDPKKDQEKNKPEEGQGGQGSQGKKEEKESSSETGNGQEEKKDQEQKEQNSQGSGAEDQSKADKKEGSESKENSGAEQENKSEKEDKKSEEDKGKEQEKEAGATSGQGSDQENQQGESEEEEEVSVAPKPKTAEERRAEQILNAIENQEKQILKMQGGQKPSTRRQPHLVDKDW